MRLLGVLLGLHGAGLLAPHADLILERSKRNGEPVWPEPLRGRPHQEVRRHPALLRSRPMTHAVCPGSFDPPTLGHLDVIGRAAGLFDRVTVAVLVNPDKKGMFTLDERLELLRGDHAQWPNVTVDSFHGLLVDYCTDERTSPRSSRGCGRCRTSTTNCRWRR